MADIFKHNENDFVTMSDFKPFCKTHLALLVPLLSVQHKLRNAAMGQVFWEELSRRQIQLRRGCKMPISDLMVLVSTT